MTSKCRYVGPCGWKDDMESKEEITALQDTILDLRDENAKLTRALETIADKLGPNAGPGAYWRQRLALTALGRAWPEDGIEWE